MTFKGPWANWTGQLQRPLIDPEIEPLTGPVTDFPRLTYQPFKPDIMTDLEQESWARGGVDAQKLGEMLSFRRPHKTESERSFVRRFIMPLKPEIDGAANLWIKIGSDDVRPPILFSCHTDTVHYTEGAQRLILNGDRMMAWASSCLGADDGAGVWLMLEMIKHRIPGTYVFHRGEEKGGIGSRHVAEKEAWRLKDIKFAIAFDRKGYDSIVTHQSGERTASEAFAKSLSDILGKPFKADNGGLFTDTSNYKRIVPECSNISVGYFNAHSSSEYLDIPFIKRLRDTLINADWSKLVCERDPKVIEHKNWDNGSYYRSKDNRVAWNGKPLTRKEKKANKTANQSHLWERPHWAKPTTIWEYIVSRPGVIVGLLVKEGWNLAKIQEYERTHDLAKAKAFVAPGEAIKKELDG